MIFSKNSGFFNINQVYLKLQTIIETFIIIIIIHVWPPVNPGF